MTEVSEKLESSHRSINVSLVSSSVHDYLNYSKKMQIRLAELNNNVSSVIKESCTGIDDICNKVRQCLFDMDRREMPQHFSTDEITEYEIVEEKMKSDEDLSQEVDEILEKMSLVEILNPEETDQQAPESTMSLTPFFTLLNCNNQGDSENQQPCQKQILNKTIYSVMYKDETTNEEVGSMVSLDNFTETMDSLCDNFELMNRLVENINKQISQFSVTAIPEEERVESHDLKGLNKSIATLKPIKRLSKINSRQKSVQVGDYLSDNEIEPDLIEIKRDSSSFIIPDVYRKRGFTDLYQRLVTQVEANDSLMFFQNLMNRQKKLETKSTEKNSISQMKLNIPKMNYSIPKKTLSKTSIKEQPPGKKSASQDITKKYANSLWFSQKAIVKDRTGTRRSAMRAKKAINALIENKSIKVEEYPNRERKRSRSRKSNVSESSKPKKVPKTDELENAPRRTCSLECTCKMVVRNDMPPSASTKCHLQWLRAKSTYAPQRKLEFLDILDDLTIKDLLPLQSEYPRKDNQQPRELDYKDVQNTYLYKLMYGRPGNKDVWKQLLEPTVTTFSKKPYNLCKPKKIKEEKITESFMDKFCSQKYSRTEVLKKLSQYIYDPEKKEGSYNHTVIVMPVRVYYDNYRPSEPPTKLKNQSKSSVSTPKKSPPSLFKEVRGPKRGEWLPAGIAKPVKVVYDGVSKKTNIPPTTSSSTRTPTMDSSRPMLGSARVNIEKTHVNKSSRSFSPKSFAPYCHEPRTLKKDHPQPTVKRNENAAIYNKIQLDIEKIKTEIYGSKYNSLERKLWENKYGKTIGQQLINHVQHQACEASRPLPKYAIPKLKNQTHDKVSSASFFKKVNPHRQLMLSQVQGMKMKNDAIQMNIKKAIDIIESQMVDILCDDCNSVDPFDIMEKEITNVLSLMKCSGSSNLIPTLSKGSVSKGKAAHNANRRAKASLEEDYNIISDQLFERLQRILDTGGSSIPNTSTDESLLKRDQRKEREELKKKQKVSTLRRSTKNNLSSSTSASMEEKSAPKRTRLISKRPDKSDMKPKLTPAVEPISQINWNNICGDQNTTTNKPEIESDIKETEEKCISYVCEEQCFQKSAGDFFQQDDIAEKDVLLDNKENDSQLLDTVISDDTVEKLLPEEKSDVFVPVITDAYEPDNNENTTEFIIEEINKIIPPIINSYEPGADENVTDFISDEIDKIVDSISALQYETSLDKLQTVERVPSSHYSTPRLESPENDTKEILENSELLEIETPIPERDLENVNLEFYDNIPPSCVSTDYVEKLCKESMESLNEEYTHNPTSTKSLEVDEELKEEINYNIPSIEIPEVDKTAIKYFQESTDWNNSSPKFSQSEENLLNGNLETCNNPLNDDVETSNCNIQSPKQLESEENLLNENLDTSNYVNVPLESPQIDKITYESLESSESNTLPKQLELDIKEGKGDISIYNGLPIPVFSDTDKKINVENQSSTSSFSDQVQKIIRRVEDIYSQLDDIQNTDSDESIPVFRDAEVSEVQSDIFLTPFMQAVKENRKTSEQPDKMALIEKSPSYYNVMSFLDTLNAIQKETPQEIHAARLYIYAYVFREAIVYHQAEIWHQVIYSVTNSCLKRESDEANQTKNKRVSFYDLTREEKSSQINLCPFHKVKVIRISSQQFPPLEEVKENMYTKETSTKIEQQKCKPESGSERTDKSDTSHKCRARTRCNANKSRDPDKDHQPRKQICVIHGDTKTVHEQIKHEPELKEEHTKPEVGCEKTKEPKVSNIDDKSTQVFCQMQKEEISISTATEENAGLTSNDEHSTDCPKLEENPDDSKSTDKDFLEDSLIDPFYDYTNDSITTKGVLQRIGGVYEEAQLKQVNIKQIQPKIVVFREVIDGPNLIPALTGIVSLNDIEQYKKRLEKRKEIRLQRKSSTEIVKRKVPNIECDSENVVFLKSFYAIVYILMFTALSLDYTCL